VPDLNDIHLMLGRLLEGQENLERGITGVNARLDNNVQPVLDDYQNTKNRIIGFCLAVSGAVGGTMAWVIDLFRGGHQG
jgi:hypothetical protein